MRGYYVRCCDPCGCSGKEKPQLRQGMVEEKGDYPLFMAPLDAVGTYVSPAGCITINNPTTIPMVGMVVEELEARDFYRVGSGEMFVRIEVSFNGGTTWQTSATYTMNRVADPAFETREDQSFSRVAGPSIPANSSRVICIRAVIEVAAAYEPGSEITIAPHLRSLAGTEIAP